jgi:spore coat protein CotF
MEQNKPFDDCAKITDFLNCEKHMTEVYNTFLCETETVSVRSCLSGILNDEHSMQESLFGEMKTRGWYTTETADQSKLNQAKQKFLAGATSGM